MATGLKSTPAKKTQSRPLSRGSVLYLYAVSRMPKGAPPLVAAEGVDGRATVEALPCEGYICWISRVPRAEFGGNLNDRMEDLEWLASASLRHQVVVAEVSQKLDTLPARFATIFLNGRSLGEHITEKRRGLEEAFDRVADADEWGIKVFATAKRKAAGPTPASSGAEYLKRRAEMLHPRGGKVLDEELREFIAELADIAVASSPGGKASAGQPALLWHGSFLIRRKDRKKLENALQKTAKKWRDARRIDCSGPWPPYSFVGEYAQ